MTDFYTDSRTFGKLHAKDGDYWDSTVEMAARAFACYVADKTNKQNDYLSAHSDSAVTLDADRNGNPVIVRAFPVGEERTAINNAFDNLIEALKDDGFLHEREQTEKPATVSYSLDEVFEEDESFQIVPENLQNQSEISTNTAYNGDSKWHTDLSKTQIKQVLKWLDNAGTPEANRITDTAYWYKGRIDGEDLFVIYSAEDPAGKTILYEVKGEQAKVAKDALLGIIEVKDNDGNSKDVDAVLASGWLQYAYNVQNSITGLGRGQNNSNVGSLQGQSKRNPSRAFWNVIDNLFAKQGELIQRPEKQYSLEITDEFFDALDDLRNGKKNAADKLAKYVDDGTISIEEFDRLVKQFGSMPEGENPYRKVKVPKKTADGKKVSQTVRAILEAKITPDAAIPTIEKMVEEGGCLHRVQPCR